MELGGKLNEKKAEARGLDDNESIHDNEVEDYFDSQQSAQDVEDEPAHRIKLMNNGDQ